MSSNQVSIKRRLNTVKLELETQRQIRFACPECGKRFKVDERFAGKKGRCPCGNHIHILERKQTLGMIRPRHRSLRKVGLFVGGLTILSGIVWMAIVFSGSGAKPMDNHVPDKKVRHEVVKESTPLQRYKIKPDVPEELWQKVRSIPQIAMEQPFVQTSYSQIQRQCELALANSPDSHEVRNIWEQVRFFEKCSWCRGLGSGTCKQCDGRGIQHVPSGFKEESLPIFTYANPKNVMGNEFRTRDRGGFGISIGIGGDMTWKPPPFPYGLSKHVKWIHLSQAGLYECRGCSYYDMPTLVEPSLSDSIQRGQYRAKKIEISFPKTYVWTGRTGTTISLRLQQIEYDMFGLETDANSRFLKPLETCPKCGRNKYILKTRLTREVECDECGGKGEVDSCPVCRGSGLERLTEERKLTTPVLLNNHVTFEGIRIDFVGKNCTFTTMPRRHTQVLIHLYPGKYRMLLSWGQMPNIQGIEATPSFAVSEEVEVKHHATYMSRPVFSFSLHGQGNVKLTKVTRQKYDNIKNLTKTPVLD